MTWRWARNITKFTYSIKLGHTTTRAETWEVWETQAGNNKVDIEKHSLIHLGENKPKPGHDGWEELWKLAHRKIFRTSSGQQTLKQIWFRDRNNKGVPVKVQYSTFLLQTVNSQQILCFSSSTYFYFLHITLKDKVTLLSEYMPS